MVVPRRRFFIVDANVLLDFLHTDPTVIRLIAEHLGPVHVPQRILEEVQSIDVDCASLGMEVVLETVQELTDAQPKRGALSFQDRLILLLAKRRGWTCITNDVALRRALLADQVAMSWGLETLLALVEAQALDPQAAIDISQNIAEINPSITGAILAEFARKVRL
jgi:predicted nucleic acid-binding protein